ncbi:EcsC family protein [Fournierella massiliensis]|uniref:EcsC family protein n=1 Tax=Allofournierella massiliensis TaxID=1650663 RepID=UPI00352265D6
MKIREKSKGCFEEYYNREESDMETKVKQKLDFDTIMRILDACYQKAINGVEYISPSVEELAEDYLNRYPSASEAARKMMSNQIVKCTTSGVITGFGGVLTLPIAVPANVSSVLYVQMRMIACTAYLAGYDLKSDQVQTLVYACLAGVAVNGVLKKAGIQFGQKIAMNLIKKIPGEVLTKINQKVGFRFLTKFGEKGLINLGKMVPGVGAAISGGLDFAETKIIAERAYRWFFENDFTVEDKKGILSKESADQ